MAIVASRLRLYQYPTHRAIIASRLRLSQNPMHSHGNQLKSNVDIYSAYPRGRCAASLGDASQNAAANFQMQTNVTFEKFSLHQQ